MNLISSIFLLNKHKHSWLWPAYCNNHPKTLSFRATVDDGSVCMNSNNNELVTEPEVEITTLGSFFTNSSETASVSTTEYSEYSVVETIVRGVRSERLFFESDPTSSMMDTHEDGGQCTSDIGDAGVGAGAGASAGDGCQYEGSMAVVVESENPYVDFKKSMEEMVEVHGLKDWECLEELLGWYLKMNEKSNYEFIVGAFVDLLVGISGGGGGGGGGDGGGDDEGGGGLFLDDAMASFSSVGSRLSSPVSSTNGS